MLILVSQILGGAAFGVSNWSADIQSKWVGNLEINSLIVRNIA